MQRVEMFSGYDFYEIQDAINAYCSKYLLEPVTASMCFANGEYIAAVVVREVSNEL